MRGAPHSPGAVSVLPRRAIYGCFTLRAANTGARDRRSLRKVAMAASEERKGVIPRTAVYGPVRTVVWQGPAGDRRPYADPPTSDRAQPPGTVSASSVKSRH
jgi:hypothetical protein